MHSGRRVTATTRSAWRSTSARTWVIPRTRTTTPLCGKGIEVRSASGGAALVTRHARGARGDAAKIGAFLSEIWSDKLPYREAHEVTLADGLCGPRCCQPDRPRRTLGHRPDRGWAPL